MGKDQISILILKDSGKLRQFRLSSKSFRIMVILAIFLSLLSLISIYGFFYLLRDKQKMRERNEQMAREIYIAKRNLNNVQSALNDVKRKLALEKTMVKKPREKEPTAQMPQKEINKGELPPSLRTRPIEQEKATFLYPAETKDQRVGIRDFKTVDSKDPSRLQVNFTIFNKDSQHRLVKGRIIMVAARETKEPPIYISFPRVPLRWGAPANPKMGYRFSIRRFMKIEGYFRKPSVDIRFDKVTIFIYSWDGTLIFREEFPIEERPIKESSG